MSAVKNDSHRQVGEPSPSTPNRWRRPWMAVLIGLLGAFLTIPTASRLWASATVTDSGLGATRAVATGSQVVPSLVALVLAAVAGLLAAVTAGRIGRIIGTAVTLASSLVAVVLIGRFLLAPGAALGRVAAEAMGRVGSIPVTSTVTSWPWVALAGLTLLLISGVLGVLGVKNWRGLSARYETDTDVAGARGERVSSDWDRLSAGEDPTVVEDNRAPAD